MIQKIQDYLISEAFRSDALSIGIRILLLIILIYFSEHYFRKVIRKLTGKFLNKQKGQTIENVSVELLRGLIAFLLIFVILGIFGVSESALAAVSGGVTLAIGFGARNFIADIFAGLTILVEESFGVGDSIILNGKSGTVSEIGVRTTIMTNGLTGETIIIPNRDIKIVNNLSVINRKAVIQLPLSRDEKFTGAYAILEEGCRDFTFEGLLAQPTVEGIIAYTANGYLIQLSAYADSQQVSAIERALRKYFLELLKEKEIIVPVTTEDMNIEK